MKKIEELNIRFQKEIDELVASDPELKKQIEQTEKEYHERDSRNKILDFIRELATSDATIPRIFLQGSCFRLYSILKVVFPTAEPFYSHQDGHWVTKINGSFYDINGELSPKYIEDEGYEPGTKIEQASAYVHTQSNGLATPYDKYIETI